MPIKPANQSTRLRKGLTLAPLGSKRRKASIHEVLEREARSQDQQPLPALALLRVGECMGLCRLSSQRPVAVFANAGRRKSVGHVAQDLVGIFVLQR